MYTVMRTENRRDSGVLDAASVRQQRRLKQAIRFLHKDSADLLPLDGLKKLGTSNQGQPHHILQKRLLEAKLSRGRMSLSPGEGGGEVLLNMNHFNSDDEEEEEEGNLIYIPCKCFGQDVIVLIDTGCRLNLISSFTVDRLGLRALVDEDKTEADGFPFQRNLCVDGRVKDLNLTVGQCRVLCSFAVIDSNRPMITLGSRTLMSLKSVVDLEQKMLVFGTTVRAQVDFVKKPLRERFL